MITSKDHASVQISIVDVDAEGKALSTSTTFALCGQVRADGESDDSINRLATKEGCEFIPPPNAREPDNLSSTEKRVVVPKVECCIFEYTRLLNNACLAAFSRCGTGTAY